MVRPIAQFALIGLAALVIVGLTTSVASRRVGEREAITDARTTTLVKAQGLVEPAVVDALAAGDPAAVARIDEVVKADVLDASLVRVKIWTGDGTVVYSDEPSLEGLVYPLGEDELDALQGGKIAADVSSLTSPENIHERDFGKLLQVYLPIRTPSGERLLFEAYFRYDVVSASGWRIWRSFAPITLGALLALELLQIPLAWGLARQLQQRQNEREELLRRTLEASDVERRRIASDLHDGVVQDLAGVSFTLAGAARKDLSGAQASGVLDDAASSIRASITGLRSLLVDIYPRDLDGEGLSTALSDLVADVASDELTPHLDADGLVRSVPTPVATLLYRAAREALRNVVQHAEAHRVDVTVGADAEHAWLSVVDDGIGFDPVVADVAAAGGHFGLRGLTGLVDDAGG
ncbi:MAG TPA: histidine kinase, partial [Acidimicrobiales bacterium]